MKTKLPEGWKIMKLMDVAENISAGGTPAREKKEYWLGGNISWLKISDMKSAYINKTEENITKEGLENSSAKLFPKGTLVYSIFATLGAIGILEIDATTNQAIAGIIPKEEIISTKYLYYCLQAERDKILAKKSHATQDNLNLTILRNHEIAVPPLPIQKKIVSILERAKKAKEWRKEADELTDDFLKAVFMEMFFDRGKFSTVKIKDVVVETENENPEKTYPNNVFEYVDISSIDNKQGKIVNSNKILGRDAPSRAKQKIKFNDLVISTVRPNLNSVALVPKELDQQICSTGFCVLRADLKKVLPEYLYRISRSNQFIESMNKIAKGASYPAVSDKDILNYDIPLPPIELQQKFASIVKEIEAMKEQQKHSKEQIDNLFNVLMQKTFKGELVI